MIDRLLCELEIELDIDDTGGLDIEVEGGGEDVKLKELDKELGRGEEGGSEPLEVVVVDESEDEVIELDSSVLSCERAEGSGMSEDILVGRLVDEGLSDVGLGVLDVGGESCEDADTGGLLVGGGPLVDGGLMVGEGLVVGGGISVVGGGVEDGGTGGEDVGTSGVEMDVDGSTGGEEEGTSGVGVDVGGGVSVVEVAGTGGELRGGGSFVEVTGGGTLVGVTGVGTLATVAGGVF